MPQRKSPKQDPDYIPLRRNPNSFRPVRKTGTELEFVQGDTPYGDEGERRMHEAEAAADRAQTVREEESKAAYKAQVESTPEFGFTKENGDWAIKAWDAPDAKEGDEVTVTKKSGEPKQLTLGALLREDRRLRVFAIAKDKPKAERTQPSAPSKTTAQGDRYVEAGMYRLENGDIVRVYFGQQSGVMLAKKLVNDHGDHWDWDYMGKASRFIEAGTPKLSIEEAAKFGKMTGSCAVCARRLDVPESVERGIGPVCFGRMESDEWLTPKQIARLGVS